VTAFKTKLAGLLNRGRLLHYADIFIAAFVVDLGENQQHILGAHGVNAWKALLQGAAVIGGKAVIEAYRKSSAAKPAAPPVEPPKTS
jgi:hypothetical protein